MFGTKGADGSVTCGRRRTSRRGPTAPRSRCLGRPARRLRHLSHAIVCRSRERAARGRESIDSGGCKSGFPCWDRPTSAGRLCGNKRPCRSRKVPQNGNGNEGASPMTKRTRDLGGCVFATRDQARILRLVSTRPEISCCLISRRERLYQPVCLLKVSLQEMKDHSEPNSFYIVIPR